MRRIDLTGNVDVPDDMVAEATRKIVLAALHARPLGGGINIGPVLRQALFYVYEGGEKNKFSPKRPHSREARKIRDQYLYYISKCKKHFKYDHAIPLCLIYDKIEGHASDLASFKAFLNAHLQGVIITAEEDKRLDDAGLRMKMPPGSEGNDLLARYRAVGIEFEPDDEARLTRRNLS